jgi:hypothetical protein
MNSPPLDSWTFACATTWSGTAAFCSIPLRNEARQGGDQYRARQRRAERGTELARALCRARFQGDALIDAPPCHEHLVNVSGPPMVQVDSRGDVHEDERQNGHTLMNAMLLPAAPQSRSPM